jgi:type II secretory pathway pseudopilin PulG
MLFWIFGIIAKMKKKHTNFTLLEVIMSLVLVGILLGFLFSFFKNTLIAKSKSATLKEKVFQLDLFQMRLKALFDEFSKDKHCFATSLSHADAIGPALILFCDQGIDPDPAFSGSIHSMLFKSRNQQLCLCSWSKNNTPRIETLIDNIADLSIEFFSGTQWQATWALDEEDIPFPPMIKIAFLLQGEEKQLRKEFIFSLPPSASIFYEKENMDGELK